MLHHTEMNVIIERSNRSALRASNCVVALQPALAPLVPPRQAAPVLLPNKPWAAMAQGMSFAANWSDGRSPSSNGLAVRA